MPRTKLTARMKSVNRIGQPPLSTFQGRKGKKRKALLALGVESSSDESSDGDQDDDSESAGVGVNDVTQGEESVDNSQRVDSNESQPLLARKSLFRHPPPINSDRNENESSENDDNESSENEDDIDDNDDDSIEPTSETRKF